MVSSIDKKLLEEIKALQKELDNYSKSYYLKNKSIVSDEVYDAKLRNLKNLEKKINISDFSSPSNKVGASVAKTPFAKVNHEEQMLSLDNAFNWEELKHFLDDIEKEEKKPDYFCELKIDGVSISIIYKNGVLVQGITRGDGHTGEDVTSNLKLISNLPRTIKEKSKVTFRGEVYFALDEFEMANKHLFSIQKAEYKNPRNAVSGLLRTIDTGKIFEFIKLRVAIYDVLEKSYFKLETQEQLFSFLDLNRVPNLKNYKIVKRNSVMEFVNKVILNRENYNYQIDGIVIKVNNFLTREEIGKTTKFPKWAIAYKLPSEIVETKIEDIFVTIGRSGKATYNAKLTPVMLGGTTVSFATLHNYSWIKKKDIRVNDIVKLKKAGDIIPEVMESVKSKRSSNLSPLLEKENCPTCGEKLIRKGQDVDQFCNNDKCQDRVTKSIAHFVSRTAMNISDISQSIIEFLYKKGWLNSLGDIFYLNYYFDLWKNEKGFGVKSVHNILSQIKIAFSNCDPDRFLFALGLNHVGKVVAKKIIQNIGSFKKLAAMSKEELEKIPGVGEKIAESLTCFFSNPKNKRFLSEVENRVHFKSINGSSIKTKLSGIKFVITGTLSHSRNYFETLIVENGGSVSSSISRKTDYLLVGANAGSKINRAKNLGVKSISENDFFDLIY